MCTEKLALPNLIVDNLVSKGLWGGNSVTEVGYPSLTLYTAVFVPLSSDQHLCSDNYAI